MAPWDLQAKPAIWTQWALAARSAEAAAEEHQSKKPGGRIGT